VQTFDKLKLVAGLNSITIIKPDAFQMIEQGGRVISLRYYQNKPNEILIKVDFEKGEVVLEFTGKVLGKHYPQLISLDTITECFNNINAMGICKIDIEAMMEAEVVKADYTKDIKGVDYKRLIKFIRSHIINYQSFNDTPHKNGNYDLEKNVDTRDMKKRITIYDKEREVNLKKNRKYKTANGLDGEFNDVCRFEINLNSKEQIRKSLNISDNKLLSVLQSTANPIVDFLKSAIIEPDENEQHYSNMRTYTMSLVLRDCDYDLEKVEAKIRSIYPTRGTSIKNKMKPYRDLMEQIAQGTEKDYWNDVLNKLK
jgi:hypothetical protein